MHQHCIAGCRKNNLPARMTLVAMTERADWVTELSSARKSLSRGTLGEKKLQMILRDFPTSFKTEYNRDSAAMVQRLASLETDKGRGITKSTAEKICTTLFGVATAPLRMEHALKAASVPVTPVTPKASRHATDVTPEAPHF
jgi:hypothetical protein